MPSSMKKRDQAVTAAEEQSEPSSSKRIHIKLSSTKKRDQAVTASEEQGEPSSSKRIKYAEPNLAVTVEAGDGQRWLAQ